ncbi:AI-2E family transporter [Roseibium aquae]|uniref:AI-2E family transporter n=1 Tax=Roseibium aquae TaxID=1323746 RepID=A0A916T8G6_9HYPH|nr:AI-2E family transporter [Roseibium aquae]GGB35644.1 AI-2E family transporter [Roseibium aquae]
MRSPLLTLTLCLVSIAVFGWLLVVGRSLLIPFVIALVVWYLINALAEAVRQIPFGTAHLPGWVALPVSLIAIFSAGIVIIDIVTANLTELARDAPAYQARLEAIVAQVAGHLNLNDPIELSDLFPDGGVQRLVSAGATFLTTIAGSASLVFIYTLFLMLEQSTFDTKFAKLFPDSAQAQAAFRMRSEINRSIRHYFGIKTAVSIATGALTSGILIVMGLPYAALFGFIAFLLNYIPTIGSLIGVIFPSLLALVYFETLTPFFVIAIGLGIIQFSIGNLIEPRLMGSSLNLSGVVIMLSLALWGAIWGVVGMVLCVPLTVVIVIICAKIPAARPVAVLLSANGDVDPAPDTRA